jgi:hypothetical protein
LTSRRGILAYFAGVQRDAIPGRGDEFARPTQRRVPVVLYVGERDGSELEEPPVVTTSPRERVGAALTLLADGLAGFVADRMSANSQSVDDWLAAYVASARPQHARPSMTDPAFLLRVMWDNWNTAFRSVLGRFERSLVSELRDARNIWAHNEPLTAEDAYRALDSVQRLLAAVGSSAAGEVGRSRSALLQELSIQSGPSAVLHAEPTRPRRDLVIEERSASRAVPPEHEGTAGRIERAIRAAVHSGQILETPARGRPFEVARVDGNGVVLLLGERQARTPLSWPVLEGALAYLQGRGWVEIGGLYDVDSRSGTFDAYLKRHVKRATAGWVAALFETAGLVDIDRSRPARVRVSTRQERRVTAAPRPSDVARLAEICRVLPPAGTAYEYDDLVTNLLLTVLDYQQHTTAVERAIAFYEEKRFESLRTLDDLKRVLAGFTNDEEGNRDLARFLWGYELWTRAGQLRGLVSFFESIGVTTQEALRAWASKAEFETDFEGRVKGLGPAVFSWLLMRLGVDTTKPDVRVRRFVEEQLGRRLPDDELVGLVSATAELIGRSIRELDWAIWEHMGTSDAAIERPQPPLTTGDMALTADESSIVTSIATFVDDESGYTAWLRANPSGFVLNCEHPPRPQYIVLHRSKCHTISGLPARGSTFTSPFMKVCATSPDSIESWALASTAALPRRCRTCRP